MIFQHAERAGVAADAPERIHFTRWVFATARNCAASGLVLEAKACMDLASRSAGSNRGARRGLGTFRCLSSMIGWRAAGQLASCGQRLKRPSAMTLQQSFARSLQK